MKQWLETREVLDRLAALARAGGGARAALATVVHVRGSAYRHEGAKLLVAEDGSTTGNVSGGCLEQDVREVALQVIRSGQAQLRSYCSSADEIAAWDLGLGCDGQVDVFVEPALEARPRERARLDGRVPFAVCTVVAGSTEQGAGSRLIVTGDTVEGSLGAGALTARVVARARELLATERSSLHDFGDRTVFIEVLVPPPELVLCGAGDDARSLARFAAEVGFRVVVVDRRPAFLTAERFPNVAGLVESGAETLLERLTLDETCYAVVMTHNFAADQAFLGVLLRAPVPYIGMLGPHQRTERLVRNLAAAAPLDEAQRGRIYGPVGLDIGTDGAEQVALAVIAEVLAVRSGRRAESLRERAASIHAYPD